MLIRDPIHGDIELSANEIKVLDSPEVQRLRSIKQLGTAYLVYPGCTHSRFEHSLGTMAVAKLIIAALRTSGKQISDTTQQLVSIGALLHDVTHIPFGHTFEDERRIFPRHDKGSRLNHFLQCDGHLGKSLARLGILDDLLALFEAKSTDWRTHIISSALDADLLDYLRRDAYMAGLAQTYDMRIFQHFRIVDNQLVLNMAKHNMDRPDIKSEIMHLLRLRYYLTERVYFHHAKVISGAMISKALELALEHGLKEQDLFYLGDYTLFESLKQIGRKSNPSICSLVEAVESRQLMKRAYILTSLSAPQAQYIDSYHFSQQARAKLENEIAGAAGLSPADVIVYCPGDRTFREAGIPVQTKEGIRKFNDPGLAQQEEVALLEQQYQRLWRFYVFARKDMVNKVNAACETVFGLKSEHC